MIEKIGVALLLICGLLFNTLILLNGISELFWFIKHPSEKQKSSPRHSMFSAVFCTLAFLLLEYGLITLLIELFHH